MNYYNYFTEIEETFIRRRGRNLLLSPLDWALIETWQERSVPLHIILRGIEKVFDGIDKQPARKRTVKSLMYCREEIEAQYAEWLESQIGKNGESAKCKAQSAKSEDQSSKFKDQNSDFDKANKTKSELFPDEAIAAHLAKVSGELKAALNKAQNELQTTLEKVLNRLEKLSQKFTDAEALENDLEKLDALIDEKLLETLETEKLRREIEKQVASYKNKMDADVYQRTFELMILKTLRERAGIPRLSLFYL